MVKVRTARLGDCKICAELNKIEELITADGSCIPHDYFRFFVDEDEMFLVAEVKGRV